MGTPKLCLGSVSSQRVKAHAGSFPGSRVLEMGLESQESYHTIQVFQGKMFSAEGCVAVSNEAGKHYCWCKGVLCVPECSALALTRLCNSTAVSKAF